MSLGKKVAIAHTAHTVARYMEFVDQRRDQEVIELFSSL